MTGLTEPRYNVKIHFAPEPSFTLKTVSPIVSVSVADPNPNPDPNPRGSELF